MITGIVLAAGASERMGESKLLLPYRDGTVLDATIEAMVTSAVDRVIVVTGAGADGIEASIAVRFPSSSVIVVRNPDYRRGNMSSLLTATDGDPGAEAFVIVPGDMPAVRTSVIDLMVDLWGEESPWAAVAEYENRIAHPFLLSRAAVKSVEETSGEKVLGRLLIDSANDRVVRLNIAHDAPRDVNTPEDYEALDRRPE
ncbi:MAG: nucleotidyltransferase family protein [Acidimicrobiia bacterium]